MTTQKWGKRSTSPVVYSELWRQSWIWHHQQSGQKQCECNGKTWIHLMKWLHN